MSEYERDKVKSLVAIGIALNIIDSEVSCDVVKKVEIDNVTSTLQKWLNAIEGVNESIIINKDIFHDSTKLNVLEMSKLEEFYNLLYEDRNNFYYWYTDQFLPYKNALKDGNYLLAWQIILGIQMNYYPKFESFKMDQLVLEKNAANIGKILYENGKIKEESIYRDGNQCGLYRSWHPNGELELECIYNYGQLQGPYIRYHISGQMIEDCNYNNGELVGFYKSWYVTGEIKEESLYDENDGYRNIFYKNGNLKEMYDFTQDTHKKWKYNGELFRYKGVP